MTGPTTDDDDFGLAAEYVLGLLGPEERQACDARMAEDPGFRAEVALWSERLAALALAEVADATPPADLFQRIERRLFGPKETPRSWLRSLGILPAIVGAAVAGLLLFMVNDLGLLRGPDPLLTPGYEAELAAEDGGLVILAAIDAESGQLQIDRAAGGPRDGRALELWLIEEGANPVSLGVLPETRVARFDLPAGARLDTALLAVSDEPPGGSPTGQPTGDVLAAGEVTAL